MSAISTRLRLRVTPGASQSEVVGRYGDGWKVRVSAPPEDGRANDALLRLLADALAAPRSDVTIVSGHGARDKVVAVEGVASSQIERRLASAATSTSPRGERRR